MNFYQVSYKSVSKEYNDIIRSHPNFKVYLNALEKELENQPKERLVYKNIRGKEYWVYHQDKIIINNNSSSLTAIYEINRKTINCIRLVKAE